MAQKTDWNPLLRDQFDEPYWRDLQAFVAGERARAAVFPADDLVFAALHRTSYESAKVVLLGQDPYPTPGNAQGLCFSVPHGVRPPPSLVNVFAEMHADVGCEPPDHGNLEGWAAQGVLLLNTVLTVRSGQPGSHRNKGWERFTDRVIDVVNAKPERVVFLLWGNFARAKAKSIDTARHTVIASAHPSPLAADRGFFGSRPFSRANDALTEAGLAPIDWALT